MGVPGLGQYTQRSELWSRRSERAAARLGGAAARAGRAWGRPVAVGTGGRARSAPGAARSKRILGETTVDLSLELWAEVGRRKVSPTADLSQDSDDFLTFYGSLALPSNFRALVGSHCPPNPLQFNCPAPHSPSSPASVHFPPQLPRCPSYPRR